MTRKRHRESRDLQSREKVNDARTYAARNSSDDAAVYVQVEAERIARVEQARVYQKRLERMEIAIEQTESEYAQLIRQLAVSFE